MASKSSAKGSASVSSESKGSYKGSGMDRFCEWHLSSKDAKALGRQLGWNAYNDMDKRKFNKHYFLSGVKSGYKGHRKYDKKGKVPRWAK